MTYQPSMVFYYVDDMERAIEFYANALGIPLRSRMGNMWAEFGTSGLTLALHGHRPGPRSTERHGACVHLDVTDIHAEVARLRGLGVNMAEKITEEDAFWYTSVRDPDGNLLYLGEPRQTAKVQHHISYVFYYVEDMDRAVGYYNNVLGFVIRSRRDDAWAEMDTGDCTLALHGHHPGQGGQVTDGAVLNFSVEDVAEAEMDLRERGAIIPYGIQPVQGGLVLEVHDPEGNRLHFFQAV